MQEIDVEKIMQEIRQEIRDKGIEDQTLHFADVRRAGGALEMPESYDTFMMQKELLNINGSWDISLQELYDTNKVKRAIKKILKRAVGVVAKPHIAQQTAFNASVAHCISMLSYLERENEELRAEMKNLKRQIEERL